MEDFRLKAGNYREGLKKYKQGDIVHSKHNLAKAFPNKFELVKKEAVAVPEKEEVARKPNIPSPSEVLAPQKEKEKKFTLQKESKKAAVESKVDEIKESSADKKIRLLVKTYGKNVTKYYQAKADACGVLIFKEKGKGYTIVDITDNQPLKDGYVSKDEMKSILGDLGG